MTTPLTYIYKDTFVTVFLEGKPVTIGSDNSNYEKVVDALINKQWDKVPELISAKVAIKKAAETVSRGKVVVTDTEVLYNGELMGGGLVRRMLNMRNMGFDISRHIRFMENLMQNPSSTSVNELWDFMEASDLPISDDGCLLAYKKVGMNFKDLHTGTMDNSPGKIVEMERNKVDDKRENLCSSGLHFCSYNYLSQYGSTEGNARVVMVKINPRDVVSFPTDYNNSKGRCCRYEVIEELSGWGEKDVLTQEYVIEKEEQKKEMKKSEEVVSNLSSLIDDAYTKQKLNLNAAVDTQTPKGWPLPNFKQQYFFGYTENELQMMTLSSLVNLYNKNLPSWANKIKKFRDKKTAVRRIMKYAKADTLV